ncbi:ankyrin repeats (3 copies) domain-containing protein [Trichoderma breve]|uniref:Ankyrin repeats (3 copies) domain-containing protein n=1 Tax=Trichoderma breve TaxID=2034170 RepID=A0A9W9E6L0_9HYPO|nr:ankyrin repeats (3 copies) domain-containing protein [Trichoderma breve]KAJ4856566.1 ankyrin repeats (3 copies) domain-containing protein [Trichoderma breve]
MLDCKHGGSKSSQYTLGRIGDHNVVIACLPAGLTGTNAAATVAAKLILQFTSIRFGLLVGIGGGVPSRESDIRLGDVVYDFGKTRPGEFETTGFLNTPPIVLLDALSKIQADHLSGNSKFSQYLQRITHQLGIMPDDPKTDTLFESSYEHVEGPTCENCDDKQLVHRKPRNQDIVIHYGTVASGNQVIRDGITRDKLSSKLGGILCFEMEAAGLMNSFPCLVIRGICDYADSHKNKAWQPYAASAAASYAREVLAAVNSDQPSIARIVDDTTKTEMLRAEIDSNIDTVDLSWFLSILPTIDQGECDFDHPSPDWEKPEYYWIFRNADFKKWDTGDSSRILWLTGPPECNIRKATSFILHREMEKSSKTNRLVLHFFCSAASVKGSSIAMLIRALAHQIISTSSQTRQMSIMRKFLRTILSNTFKRMSPNLMQRFSLRDSNSNIKNLLESPDDGLWAALWAIMPTEQSPELSIVIDGIEHIRDRRGKFVRRIREFVEDLQRTSKAKILLTSGLESDTAQIFNGLPHIEYDKERKECLSSLCFVNTRFSKIVKASEGTFEWLWEHAQYDAWSKPSVSRVLLIQGKPGSGKSTLTRYFNEHILEREHAADSAVIARFFYSYREDILQRSHYNMLRSIIHDILYQDEAFFYHIQPEYRLQPRSDTSVEWEYESLKRILISLRDYSLQRPLYLIIDAVDESEYEDRRNILKLLFQLCAEMKHGVVKVFITSRPVEQLDIRQKNINNIIQLHEETVSDISRFARSMLDDLHISRLLAKATDFIIKNAHGVFLWVKLVGDRLKASIEVGDSEDVIFQCLEHLPTELDDFYKLMFKSLSENKPYIPESRTMFQIVLWAVRPLTVNELLHALAMSRVADVESDLSDDVFDGRIPTKTRITHCGGNFLEVKQPYGASLANARPSTSYRRTNKSMGNEVVQAMHQTVRDFFLSSGGCVANSELRMSNDDEAHIFMSKICIRYLMLCVACTTLAKTLPTPESPFAKYALSFLKHHMSHCHQDARVSYLAIQLANSLTGSPSSYLLDSWVLSNMGTRVQGSHDNEHEGKAMEFRAQALHAAVWNDFPVAVEILLTAGTNINSRCEKERTFLSLAAERGHEAIAELLLAHHGIEADTKDIDGRTPLSWVAEKGHSMIAEMLLARNDVAPDSKDMDERTPLSWAAEQGHGSVVQMLLACNDVDADSVDKSQQTPLSRAAKNGHKIIADMLIQHNVVATSRDGHGRTPLWLAAEQGHEEIVELLLALNNGEADESDRYGRTPLSRAAGQGRDAIVKLLLNRNIAKADSKDQYNRTPLSWAARHGHGSIVELLLERHDVEPDSKDFDGRTPLSWAAWHGQHNVVRLLLDHKNGVQVTSEKKSKRKLLLSKFARYYKGAKKRFVGRKGVEADSRDDYGQTPLSRAAEQGHEAVVKLLLDRIDVEINSRDTKGWTPLSWAADQGHHDVTNTFVSSS